jgi:alpha-glucoside transport system permease protein
VTGAPTLFEIPTREDTRPKVAGRAALPRWALLAPLPAVLAVLAVLVVPLGWTFARSLRRDGRFVGLGEYRVFADDRVARATANSVWWVLFALVLGVAGLALAELARRAGGSRTLLLAVLAAPTAVSAFVAGAAFRLLFDPDPDRGTVAALIGALPGDARPDLLGPGFIAVVLGSAFAWSWIGLAVVVFAAGLRAVPTDRLRMARSAGVGPYGRLRKVLLPALRPVLATVLLTLLVAAARIFDLVLVAVPGSVQEAADVVGLQWLRRESDLADGQRAALVVVLTLFLAAAALLAAAGGSSRRSLAAPEPGDPDPAPPRRRAWRWTLRGVGAAALAFWLVPFVVLVATSLRDPAAAAVHGWWTGGGLSLRSYRDAFASGELAGALTDTATRAVLATTAVLVLAVPAAYALAWGGLRRRSVRRVAAVCAVLAVLPVQAYAGPLGDALSGARWLGSPTVLAGVHAAAGVPFAVLLLRGAFATVPAGEVVRQRLDGGEWQAANAVLEQRWESVVAVAVLEFVLVWNDLVVGLLLATPGSRLVTLALLAESREFATNASALAAGAVVVTVVPLLLVLATGRRLIRGLAAGVAR